MDNFVDTNFLYSILNLHSHPENQAAKAVLQLGKELGIKFQYIYKTFEELINKKKDFDSYLERSLEISQIRALLKSNKLDSFARTYYEKKLEDPINTPHPTDIIKHSNNNLIQKGLTVYQSRFEAMSKNVEYLLDQESKYSDYLTMLDELRKKNVNYRSKGKKDGVQIQHDVFLREAILFMRKKNVTQLSEARYFGVTLDKTLLRFDHYQTLQKSHSTVIPTFFYPSILLKKLLKYAPIKSEDYLRAFLMTISTPALDDNVIASKTAIRSVKYFHSMGINDEKLILDCLKEEMFLSNFESNENSQEHLGEFVESEINKQISKSSNELKNVQKKLRQNELEISKIKDTSLETNSENFKLNNKIKELKESLELHTKALRNFKPKNNNSQIYNQLSIDDEREKILIDNQVADIRNENKKLKERLTNLYIKRWKLIGYLSIIPAILQIIFFIFIFIFQDKNWNFVRKFIDYIQDLDDTRKNIAIGLILFSVGAIDYFLVKIFKNRILNNESLELYRQRIVENKIKENE